MLYCIVAADAAIQICNGLRSQVVLQVTIAVKQHLQLSVLARLKKVRFERMLVLHPCLVSTMPTALLLLGHHTNDVLRVDDNSLLCIQQQCFNHMQWCCLVTSNEKHCHTSAVLSAMNVVNLLNGALMQTFMNQPMSLCLFLQGIPILCKAHNTPSG